MKKIALCIVFLLASFSNFAIASPSQPPAASAGAVLPDGMPETLSLLDETPLYSEPDDKLEPSSTLSPQNVKVIGTQYGDGGFAGASGETWVQIQTTWLGAMWIKLDNGKLGVIRPFTADLNLEGENKLYDRPYPAALNKAVLSPQTVHAKAEFVSPSGFYAIQIETTWLGDMWLIHPNVHIDAPAEEAGQEQPFPDAVSPDYGSLMRIADIHFVQLGERSFAKGKLVVQKDAWSIGRFNPGPIEMPVSGKLSFWSPYGDLIAQVPYAVPSTVGDEIETNLLLPLDADVSSAVMATLQNTIPIYISLPLPPLFNLSDPDEQVILGILRHQHTGSYSVAKAWISGKLPGSHDYKITLTFYGPNHEVLGYAHIHQRLTGPPTPEQAGSEGGGTPYLTEITGNGIWDDYSQVAVRVDQVSD
ncbi:hypothetical protein N0M98_09955 [Paenibacillus doosanensis]|uniref:Uncharacterized protein n=1 Tax=Paenibacillus konkukensis TaxID=2020716 RepID=A0ABY4S234_9BACL|nr:MULTISPECIES: hypothetical protein [Paenibacillus]MCS7460463.1 hypothetical protein [Paenibacillus doosanensis]UQZ87493.1 hypothetical protein SK3146_06795 [Paenibacillus konkukensis]